MSNSKGYKDSKVFLSKYNNITYPEFDYYSVTELNLFSSVEDINFKDIGEKLYDIEKILPAIGRIFAKPIIHLIDEDVLVPVEAVRLISNKTMSYASVHSDLQSDKKAPLWGALHSEKNTLPVVSSFKITSFLLNQQNTKKTVQKKKDQAIVTSKPKNVVSL